jgi:hypothetical protein
VGEEMSKRNISCYVSVEIHPSADELAEVFCAMDDEEQAGFFNRIAEITKAWEAPFCFQLNAISESKHLNDDGRKIMAQIGEYAEAAKK